MAYSIVVTAREQAELKAVEQPAEPMGPREVAGRTLATLISPGTEVAGNYAGGHVPSTPGYAAVFEAEEVGSEVPDVRAGDRLFCMGPHRSFQRIARENALVLPEGLGPQVAVFARLMGVSMSTLNTATARPPAKVLVTGLGLVGHLAAQIFAACGYQVAACDPVESRRDLARSVGIEPVFPAVPLDDARFADQVALVLECSGHEQAALDGCRLVRKRGEVVLVGTPWRRQTDLAAHELLTTIFHRYVVVRSGWEWELPLHPADFRGNAIFDNLAAALRWLAGGRVRVDRLAATRPPREAQQAYQDALHKCPDILTTVFDWTDCP